MAFNPRLQNLIDSSGHEVAAARSAQLSAYVERISTPTKTTPNVSFGQLLQQTKMENPDFGIPQIQAKQVTAKKNEPYSYVSNLTPTQKADKSYILNIVSQIAKKYNMDERLINAVIKQESGFKTDAVSHAGAMGLMQLMPTTAKGLGVTDPMNHYQNIDGGVRHLKGLLAKYKNNLVLALAAYNAGGGNVDKYGGIPPFKETQNYVKSFLKEYLR